MYAGISKKGFKHSLLNGLKIVNKKERRLCVTPSLSIGLLLVNKTTHFNVKFMNLFVAN